MEDPLSAFGATVRVEELPELGRVLVAAREIQPGELLLSELPLLSPAMARIGEGGQWPNLLRAYASLPDDALQELMIVLAFAQAAAETTISRLLLMKGYLHVSKSLVEICQIPVLYTERHVLRFSQDHWSEIDQVLVDT